MYDPHIINISQIMRERVQQLVSSAPIFLELMFFVVQNTVMSKPRSKNVTNKKKTILLLLVQPKLSILENIKVCIEI